MAKDYPSTIFNITKMAKDYPSTIFNITKMAKDYPSTIFNITKMAKDYPWIIIGTLISRSSLTPTEPILYGIRRTDVTTNETNESPHQRK